jgi:uncharacterized protein (TIGR00297 family)
VAWRLRLVTRGGALIVSVLGSTLLAAGDTVWIAAGIAFFIPSSVLSKMFVSRRKDSICRAAKTDVRDASQVLANGAVSWLMLIAWFLSGEPLLVVAYVGAFAAASSDTWATEIGTIARSKARCITNLREVPAGVSGAVSVPGFVGAALGAAIVALAASFFDFHAPGAAFPLQLVAPVSIAGFTASVVDSLFGATVQAMYRDPESGELRETDLRSSGDIVRGYKWINNDVVNLMATAAGALLSVLFAVAGGGLFEI